jgi:hypothetical protein
MMHTDQMYQLRQQRNHELVIEAQRARIVQEFVYNQRMFEYSKSGAMPMRLAIRCARYLLSTLATVGFGIQLN